jgi:hypothetical protein
VYELAAWAPADQFEGIRARFEAFLSGFRALPSAPETR